MSLTHPTLIVSDHHVPFHDQAAIDASIEAGRAIDAEHVVFNGDLVDCYKISKYASSPDRHETLQDELDATIEIIAQYRRAFPRAEFTYIQGNHEDRLRRLIWDNPGLAGLACLEWHKLLRLEQFRFARWYEYGGQHLHHGAIIEHGDTVRGKGSYTARAMVTSRLTSGVSGHTHRLGLANITTAGADLTWVEGGCLCDMEPEYLSGTPDWQHGCVVGHVVNARFAPTPVRIFNGTPVL